MSLLVHLFHRQSLSRQWITAASLTETVWARSSEEWSGKSVSFRLFLSQETVGCAWQSLQPCYWFPWSWYTSLRSFLRLHSSKAAWVALGEGRVSRLPSLCSGMTLPCFGSIKSSDLSSAPSPIWHPFCRLKARLQMLFWVLLMPIQQVWRSWRLAALLSWVQCSASAFGRSLTESLLQFLLSHIENARKLAVTHSLGN
jgi:hypothetical protein